jgi:hypothetical protein
MLYFATQALIQWKFEAPSKAMKRAERDADHSLSFCAKGNIPLTLPPLHHTPPWNVAQVEALLCLALSLRADVVSFGEMGLN